MFHPTDGSARIFYPTTLCRDREWNSHRFSCTSSREINSGSFTDWATAAAENRAIFKVVNLQLNQIRLTGKAFSSLWLKPGALMPAAAVRQSCLSCHLAVLGLSPSLDIALVYWLVPLQDVIWKIFSLLTWFNASDIFHITSKLSIILKVAWHFEKQELFWRRMRTLDSELVSEQVEMPSWKVFGESSV